MPPGYVVVDGSNIATEGRSIPSLAALDEAVTQFQAEFPGNEIIVVVDATFGHRIDPSERRAFDEAVAHGEIVSPPAGAVGRGDAFVLRVAERTGAQVLSNDSFQEFHAEHPWLFEEGRLVGGKPIPGVGWIFTPRNPVRGARSRAVRSERPQSAGDTDKAARAPRGAKAPTASTSVQEPHKARRAKKTTEPDEATKAEPLKRAKKAQEAEKRTETTKAEPLKRAKKAPKAEKRTEATKGQPSKNGEPSKRAKPSAKAENTEMSARGEKAEKPRTAKKAATPTGGPSATTEGRGLDDGRASSDAARSGDGSRRRRGRRATAAAVRAAIDVATAEATGEPAEPQPVASRQTARRRSRLPAAVNDPLTFLTFVTEHPVGSEVDGVVSSFVSHGAMVEVDGMQCYVPLAGLGSPAPRRAREVLERGQSARFTLVALDPARRGAELALPAVAAARRDR